MAPHHVFKYPKCVQAQKGQYLFIYEALGPVGCITTEIFSENHCCLKRRFSENLDSTASTGQLEQKMTLFAIFRDVTGGTDTRKIVKNRSHIAKFRCGSGAILVILFKKIRYFFSKIRKKWKKLKKIF